MGIWVESHDQRESNAEISGPIGARQDIHLAAPVLFEFGGGHMGMGLGGPTNQPLNLFSELTLIDCQLAPGHEAIKVGC